MKENREKKMAARTFLSVFFRVTYDGLSERWTTRSLEVASNSLRHLFHPLSFQAVFLNVLYKSLKSDPSLDRVKVSNNPVVSPVSSLSPRFNCTLLRQSCYS